VYGDLSLVDVLVALTVLSIGLDLIRTRRPLYVPGPLKLPLMVLVIAMTVGFVTGHAAGGSIRFVLASENVLGYLVLLPVAVANLNIDRRQIKLLLVGAMALAIVKAVLGLLEVASGHGTRIEGSSVLTYYEPAANWLMMIAVLALFAAMLARVRPPLWMLLGAPLLIASLALSYRRSFWIASVLAALLVLLLGTSAAGRRLLIPAGLCVVLAIWVLGSVGFQSDLPIVKRATSLQPSRLEANVEDRYRLDERANVLGEIRQHPISGLGMTIPWEATVRPLPVEHEGGRQYVHFAALWYWLKLGILGLFAYVGVLLASLALAWQAWRRSRDALFRGFSLASLCAIAGLVVIDTTASFTGVNARFTVLFATQLGLLALIARTGGSRQVPGDSSSLV
jgi:O-antigen ligase